MPLQIVSVPTPELGEDVTCYMTELSAEEQDVRLWRTWASFRERTNQEDNKGFRAFAAIAGMCDQDRKFIYNNGDMESAAEMLSKKPAKLVQRLYLAAAQLNGIGDAEIEKIEKN